MAQYIDILFSNAGIGENCPLCEFPVDLVRRTFETNVFMPLELARKFIRKQVDEKRPGKVVFTSSAAGLFSLAGLGPYCASKHALECIAESLHVEQTDEVSPKRRSAAESMLSQEATTILVGAFR